MPASRSFRHRPVTLAAASAVLLTGTLAGCSGGSDPEPVAKPAAPANPCEPAKAEKVSKVLLRCTATSVVRIETAFASGTGVVVASHDTRYVVTNLHVVDPLGSADISVGKDTVEAVPVVGIDALADLAVLGPLDDGDLGPALQLSTGRDLDRGDEVYLVGYPGETESKDELESTISSGIVSRIRDLKEFDQAYIQTDASIAGGQSGGPLFDERGRLVGISGLSFAEEFALALAGENVADAIERIVDGDGDEYLALPADADDEAGDTTASTSGESEFADAGVFHTLYIPASQDDRTLEFTLDPAARPVAIIQALLEEEPLAASLEAVEIQQELLERLAERNGGDPGEIPDPTAFGEDPDLKAAQVAPGSFKVDLPTDQPVTISITAPLIESATTVRWTSNLPVYSLTPRLRTTSMEVGDTIDEVVNGYESGVEVAIELEDGQEIELHARSPQSDVAFTLLEPGVAVDPLLAADPNAEGVLNVDDTDDGLYGLDAREVYEVPTTGTYRIRLYHNDDTTVSLRFSVLDCGAEDADCE